MIGMVSVGDWDDWYQPPEFGSTSQQSEPLPDVERTVDYNFYFPADWDRYLYDVGGMCVFSIFVVLFEWFMRSMRFIMC